MAFFSRFPFLKFHSYHRSLPWISTLVLLTTTSSVVLFHSPSFLKPIFPSISYLEAAQNESQISFFEKKNRELKSLKKKIIGRYENRVRAYSHPYKVFQLFASQTKNGQKYMTPKDFIRSLLPYRDIPQDEQPDEIYRMLKAQSSVQFFKLADTDGDGLISFEEYLHFLTFAILPEHHFDTQFSKLDLDHNGMLSKQEFVQFLDSLTHSDPYLQQTLGSQQRHKLSIQKCHGLLNLFFGEANREAGISKHVFLGFLKWFQLELLKLEFYQYPVNQDQISLQDFAYALVSYVDPRQLEMYHQRIQKLNLNQRKERVSFDQFVNMDKVASALQSQSEKFNTNWIVPKEQFSEALKKFTPFPLTPSQIDVIYLMFGNERNEIDFNFLTKFGRQRQAKGLSSRMEVGLAPLVSNTIEPFRLLWMSFLSFIFKE